MSKQTNAFSPLSKKPLLSWVEMRFDFGDMALALTLWLCSLPLVGLLVVPFFGLKVGVLAAVILFFVAMLICWGICGWKIFHGDTKERHHD